MSAACTLQRGAKHVKITRVLVREIPAEALTTTGLAGISRACVTLEQKSGLHASARMPVKANTGFGARRT